ncbi:hypothetical protein [Leclercia sp.]|uniref:hypothetical protein n=1 Tax=Leclercia sp. TaxID=1898428 RepID=UPI0028AE16E2|nr:hypothetical protein [Leclercia sp.]
MSKQDNGGRAFPGFDYYRSKPLPADAQGMTLRDYFAAKAMQSIVSAPKEMAELIDLLGAETAYAKASETAYVIADAMLRAREAS